MTNRIAGLLVLAIFAMAGLTFIATRTPSTDEMIGEAAIPDLQRSLGTVDEVTLVSSGLETTLRRSEKGWQVMEKQGYPADFSRLSAMLNDLAEARWIERKTARAENHGMLGLAMSDEVDNPATRVSANGDAAFSLIVGNRGENGGEDDRTFVRLDGEDQVWLTDRLRHIDADPVSWLDPVILNIDSAQVRRISFGSASGFSASRNPETDDIEIENLPADASLRYATIANSLGRSLTNVRFIDVALKSPSDTAVKSATFELVAGERLDVTTRQNDEGDYWLQFDVNLADGSPSPSIDDEALDRLQRYEFQVAESVFDDFTKTIDDMLEPPSGDEE